MPVLTEFCDIFGAVNEAALNNIIADFQNQRPSLLNYGTATFAADPQRLCDPSFLSRVDKDVILFKNPLVSQADLLSIPLYAGPYGLEYCFQLTKFALDFQPSNVIQLPPALDPPLKNQAFALQASVCAGLGVPDAATIALAAQAPAGTGKPTIPLPFTKANLVCLNLDVFAVLHVQQGGPLNDPYISLQLDGLEFPGLVPAGLESILESYIKIVLSLGLLPQIKVALSALVFNIADMLTIQPTAISANVPFNPSIEKDQIEVSLTLN
jgi:hypothetical protein